MRKQSILLSTALVAVLGFSAQAMAEDDPYTAGFEAYAKENQLMEDAIKSYIQDIKKAEKEKPDLKETKEELGHAGE